MSTQSPLDRPLVIAANRLPVKRGEDGAWSIAAGGLVTAMRPVMDRAGGVWVGWDGGDEGVPDRVAGLDIELGSVQLSKDEVASHYHGFSNRTLWPLLHDLVAKPVIDHDWWEVYKTVNERFADRIASMELDDDAMIWVHDYHLLLLPQLVRDRVGDRPIGFFLHTPFPAPELIARLPWREQLLDGMLGADVVGFHTRLYRDNFVRSVRWLRGSESATGRTIHHQGRDVEAAAQAISIDANEFSELATAPETEAALIDLRNQFGGRKVFLGVDRLDTTKGIRHRLTAIEKLLTDDPELRDQFVFIQIAVPSREDVEEVMQLRGEIEQMVGRINGQFTEPGHDVPVHYLYRGVTRHALAAYYRLADVLCVTPLKDGMNLVAKEFAVIQHAGREDGVLLLSEFTGAALTMDGAVTCNPFDVQGLAEAMARCLELDVDDRRARLAKMAGQIHTHDVFAWGEGLLATLIGAAAVDAPTEATEATS
ncbi:MAG: alpha,alpha-trehalose-phosphate synthase [UDP-forming] [Myxococcota bacterium]